MDVCCAGHFTGSIKGKLTRDQFVQQSEFWVREELSQGHVDISLDKTGSPTVAVDIEAVSNLPCEWVETSQGAGEGFLQKAWFLLQDIEVRARFRPRTVGEDDWNVRDGNELIEKGELEGHEVLWGWQGWLDHLHCRRFALLSC